VKLINTSDSDIAGAFISDTSQTAVTTWKPLVSQIGEDQGRDVTVQFVADCRGDRDLLVVRTEVLNRADGSGEKFAKAATGGVV